MTELTHWIVYALCLAASALLLTGGIRGRLPRRQVARRVAGYERAERPELPTSVKRNLPADMPEWTVLYIERFLAHAKERVIVGVSFSHQRPIPWLTHLARAVQAELGAVVVAVEGFDRDSMDRPNHTVIYAPDGRGWTRVARDQVLVTARNTESATSFRAVPGSSELSGVGWYAPPIDRGGRPTS